MKIDEIIKAVRWCIDEEADNSTSFADASKYDFDGGTHTDEGLMNNIIKAKIGDALRWVCLNAHPGLLGGSDEKQGTATIETGIMKDATPTPTLITGQTAGYITMDADFIKLARVRVEGWHRAVRTPIAEDSDEYLQLYDTNGATATDDRPQAALVEKSKREIELWPWTSGKTVEVTYVASVEPKEVMGSGSQSDTVVGYALPPKARTSIIYYIAFLLLSAYNDPRAARMLEIAKMNLAYDTK